MKRNRLAGFRFVNIGGRINNKTDAIILLVQLLLFYIYPSFSGLIDPMGMVLVIILGTFILSIIVGILFQEKIKYFYPVIISLLFIPTVFIYYNSSALVHSLWYLIVSFIGLFLGTIIKKLLKK